MTIRIADGWLRNRRKIYLLLDLNSNCNIHCIQCYRNAFSPDENGSMTREQLAILEREVFPYVDKLSLAQTAEVLLYPLLPEVLESARRSGVSFSCIQTNGTPLTPHKSKMLLDGGLSLLGISWDAATPETFEKIRAGAKWDVFVRNVENFIRLRDSHPGKKTWVSFNFAMMKQNMHEAVEFVGMAKKMGADSVTFVHLVVETPEMREWSLAYDPAESNRLSAALRREAQRWNIPARIPSDLSEKVDRFEGPMFENPSYHGVCTAAEEHWLFVMANGDCFPCLNLQDCGYVGNVFEKPFKEIWYSRENQHFRRRAIEDHVAEGCDHCKDCTFTEDLTSDLCFLAKRLTTRSAAQRDLGEGANLIREVSVLAK